MHLAEINGYGCNNSAVLYNYFHSIAAAGPLHYHESSHLHFNSRTLGSVFKTILLNTVATDVTLMNYDFVSFRA